MPGNNRSQAYIQEMEKVGLPQMILEVPFIMENVEKQKLIYDMLNAHPEIDGIFAGDDSLCSDRTSCRKAKRNQYSERSKDHRSRWNKADFRICSRTDNDPAAS